MFFLCLVFIHSKSHICNIKIQVMNETDRLHGQLLSLNEKISQLSDQLDRYFDIKHNNIEEIETLKSNRSNLELEREKINQEFLIACSTEKEILIKRGKDNGIINLDKLIGTYDEKIKTNPYNAIMYLRDMINLGTGK